MERREALKLLTYAAAFPLFSAPAFSLFQAVHERLPEAAALKTLDPHQNTTVTAISELIIPQTDTPGAKEARVNEFIDVILSEWYDEAEKSRFLAGLAEVDERSCKRFGKDFVECEKKEQTEVLTALDEELATVLQASEGLSHAQISQLGPALRPEEHFFYMMKQLTLVGYCTSEVGFKQELHEHIIPPRHAACAPVEGAAK